MTTLAIIRAKIRQVINLPSPSDITDSEIDGYINTFYMYDLPEHLRLLNLKTVYSFYTIANQHIYTFPRNQYLSIESPIYVAGYQQQLYQSRDSFFGSFPNQQKAQLLAIGNGTAGPYSGTISAVPVLKTRVTLSATDSLGNSLIAEENGLGTFTGDVVAGSTINYLTGAIGNLVWTGNIPVSNEIIVQSVNYQAARPFSVLFFHDTFTFYSVPDQAYKVEMDAYITPTALANTSDSPYLNEWWQLLAYGAIRKIFFDFL